MVSYDSIINTIFGIGCSNYVLPQFAWSPSFNLTFWTSPCFSAKISFLGAISQVFWWFKSSFRKTVSPVWKFLFFDHFWCSCKLTRNSLYHLDSKILVLCYTFLHCLWQYISVYTSKFVKGRHLNCSLHSNHIEWTYWIKAVAIT